jgi:predicted cobalt transporter CbtA
MLLQHRAFFILSSPHNTHINVIVWGIFRFFVFVFPQSGLPPKVFTQTRVYLIIFTFQPIERVSGFHLTKNG